VRYGSCPHLVQCGVLLYMYPLSGLVPLRTLRRCTSNFLGRLNCTHFVSRRFYPNVILTVLLIAKWWYFFFELLSSDIKWMLMSGSRFRTWLKLSDESLYFFNFRFNLQVGYKSLLRFVLKNLVFVFLAQG
jgi:hypothetical protein